MHDNLSQGVVGCEDAWGLNRSVKYIDRVE